MMSEIDWSTLTLADGTPLEVDGTESTNPPIKDGPRETPSEGEAMAGQPQGRVGVDAEKLIERLLLKLAGQTKDMTMMEIAYEEAVSAKERLTQEVARLTQLLDDGEDDEESPVLEIPPYDEDLSDAG